MKIKNTLLLLIFAGAFFAFIKFYESRQFSTREARERAGRVVVFDRDNVDAISIKNTETKIELRKDGNNIWRLVEPVKDRADLTVIHQLFTSAESLRHDAVIDDGKKGGEKEQLREFGLANSETKVKLTGDEMPVELLFGKETAVEGKVYVKREDSPVVYVIAKDLKEQISRKADEFRDRKLTDLNTSQVNRFVLKTSAGEIEAEKKDQHWILTKPLRARGDDSKINDLVAQTAAGHIEAFVSVGANDATYGIEEPRATVSLYSDGDEAPTVLQLGDTPREDGGKAGIYAKLSTRDAVVLLPKTFESIMAAKPNELRDKHLMRVEADIVDRITIKGADESRIVLARNGESWVRKVGGKDEEVNVAAVRRLLDALLTQRVASFVSDVSPDLSRYGLGRPAVSVLLSSYASENTAETKAGERPLAHVHFGNVENGIVYAKLEEEPFVVTVPQAIMDILMADALQWQPLEIYKGKGDDITAVEVSREGQPTLSFERDRDKAWRLARGDGVVNQINLQSLVNTLATLRAVRWVGAMAPEHDIEKPGLVVSFKTSSNTTGRLAFGTTTPEELTYASADGLKGIFVVSRPDFGAFQLPLIEKTSSAAVPSP